MNHPPELVDLLAKHLDELAVSSAANAAPPTAGALKALAHEVLDELVVAARPRQERDGRFAVDYPERAGGTHSLVLVTRGLVELLVAWANRDRPVPPIIERDAAAVRIVERLLGAHVERDNHGRPLLTVEPETFARAVVDALLAVPTAYLDGGRAVVDWPSDDVRACLMARDLVDELAERSNRLADAEDAAAAAVAAIVEAERLDDWQPTGFRNDVVACVVGPLSPDCTAGKCGACTGDAWDATLDALTDCEHPCHARAAGGTLDGPTTLAGDVGGVDCLTPAQDVTR